MLDALAFLTILPVGARSRPPGRAGLLAFPLVGLLLGALWALAAWGASWLWGPLAGAAAVLVVDLGVTGGLHLDAVADVADGWACRKPATETLAVMRDPAIGAVGAAVLGVVLLARWSLLAAVAGHGHWLALVVPPVLGRAAMVLVIARSGRPAPEGTPAPHGTPAGEGTPAPAGRPSLVQPLLGAGWPVAACAGVLAGAVAVLAAGIRGLAAVALAVTAAETGARWARRRLGGVSGDVVGAVGVAAEIGALACIAARLVR